MHFQNKEHLHGRLVGYYIFGKHVVFHLHKLQSKHHNYQVLPIHRSLDSDVCCKLSFLYHYQHKRHLHVQRLDCYMLLIYIEFHHHSSYYSYRSQPIYPSFHLLDSDECYMLLNQMLTQRSLHHHEREQGCYMLLFVFEFHHHIFWSKHRNFRKLPNFH